MTADPFALFVKIIGDLESAGIFFCLRYVRESSILIEAAVPGQRWEIDVNSDGTIDFEVFQSFGEVLGDKELFDEIEKIGNLNREPHEE